MLFLTPLITIVLCYAMALLMINYRALKTPKSEWEGAALRNSRVTCNSLLPIKPVASGSTAITANAVKAHTAAEVGWRVGLDTHFRYLHFTATSAVTLPLLQLINRGHC
jgi:E3 ubiquitin-protein ligase UBR4